MTLRVLVILATLALMSTARGADRLLLAGTEVGDTNYYSYVGVALPLGERRDGQGFVQRYWLDRFGYEYDSGNTRIDADAWGTEAALGYVWASVRGWSEVSVGARFTDTDLEPDDPEAESRGSQLGTKLQLQGEMVLAEPWRLGFVGSYANQQNEYWSRMRLMRTNGSRRALGGELIAGGNDESSSMAAGAAMTFHPAATDWSIGLHAGYRWQDESDGVYAGVELGYAF
jgi:hypothetical protein